jgi:hypothetical protein
MQKPFNKPGTPFLVPWRNMAAFAERETKVYREHGVHLILKMRKVNRTVIIKETVSTTPLNFTRSRKKGITAFQNKLSALKLTII